MHKTWKSRFELPVLKRLDFRIDIDRLRSELKQFEQGKVWDGLGTDYESLCETHTKLPKMFFKDEELEGIERVCDLDWHKASYQQLSLTEYDESFELSQRTEKSGSNWDNRIAKHKLTADERWFRKVKDDVPPYMKEILAMFPNSHRARFSLLSPNSEVKPHIDYDTLYGIRVHIVLETNDQCFNGGWDKEGNEVKEHFPADGSVWFVNPGVKHYAINGGDTPRNHLIISLDTQSIL